MPTNGPPVLSFVVPVRNDAEHLRRCLESILAETREVAAEIIVVDNGSTDRSVEVAKAAGARIIERPLERVAALRNAAARVATGEFLAFVDADHELRSGWTDAAILGLRDATVCATGAQYHAPTDGTWVQQMYDRFRRHQPGRRDVDWLPSGNVVIRRDVFNRIGGFDTSLETCEDVDFCQRLKATGGRLVADDRLRSIHRGDPKTLKALFLGELWRGRDNLRVSLRVPLTPRSLPGIAIPVVNLLALAAIAGGALTWGLGGSALMAGGAAVFSLLVAARAGALLSRTRFAEWTAGVAVQAMVVASVYDLARALALVARTGHEFRRKA
jgi:Glycosyl transferase family 2